MTDQDIDLLMAAIAPVLREFVQGAARPLIERIDALEKRAVFDPTIVGELRKDFDTIGSSMADAVAKVLDEFRKAPTIDDLKPQIAIEAKLAVDLLNVQDGKDADLDITKAAIIEEVSRQVAALPPAPAGKDADPEVVKQLVAEAVAALPKPEDGKSVTAEEVRPIVAELVGAAVAEIPAPKDGKDVDPEVVKTMITDAITAAVTADDVRPIVDEAVARAVATIPPARDGKDADPAVIADLVDKAVAAIPAAKDGKSVTLDEVRPLIADAVAALPKPVDGRSVTLDELRPLVEETIGKAIKEIPAPKDGIGIAGAVIDREGNLVVTLTDGKQVPLGRVIGKDGRDAFSLKNFNATYDGRRTLTLTFSEGTDAVEEFKFVLPIVLDAGVFKDGNNYVAGDAVSFGGSLWIAQTETKERPGIDSDWRLSVKKGRDGKDGEAPKPPAKVKL